MLKLPCTALHPARTWDSRGTCRWFGCSIRSRRSWSIQRWRSTPGKPAPQTPEHHCHRLPPTHLVPSPCPAITVGLTLCHEASPKLTFRCWSSAAAWDGGGHGFQQFGPVKSFSEHRPLCLLSWLLLKILKAVVPDLLFLLLSGAVNARVYSLPAPNSNEPSQMWL